MLGIGTLRQPFFDGPTGPTLTPPDAANAGPAQASEPGIFQRFWNGVVDVVNSYFAYKIDYDARFLGYVGTVGEATHKYQNEIDALAMTPMVTPSGIAGKAAQGVEVVAEEAALLAKEADALALTAKELTAIEKAAEAAELTHAFAGFLESEKAANAVNRLTTTGALVGLTKEGELVTLVTAGTRGLSVEQAWFARSQGYSIIRHLRGLHAESALLAEASRLGLEPLALHTTWKTCFWCSAELSMQGWELALPSLRTWIYRGPY